MKLPAIPFVIIEWSDAWGDAGAEVALQDVGDTHKPALIHTGGWLLHDDETGVSLANEQSGPTTYRGRTFIPRALIVPPYRYLLNKPRRAVSGADPP